ncbi:MAG TPA: PstS family phosphate ABC transporter substrate-binding protein [Deltaproteobacteria bacterium]|nr:PstS family phosphate ABC transporter substrate-binding protein [Deltaproteobacteria bacterium]
MKKTFSPVSASLVLTALVFFTVLGITPTSVEANDITIKGSTTVLPIAQITAETFMDQNPTVNISVQGGGSGVGIASLIDKTTDIADSSRKIKSQEVEKAKAAGVNVNEIIVAMDGIAVIIHPTNKIAALTRGQLKDIYTGKISNWSELGGSDAKIVVISRDTSSGTFESFFELALDKEKVRADALTTASNQAVAQIVAQTPGSIGYVGFGYLSSRVKDIPVDGITCTKPTIVSGAYPLSRPLYMYTDGSPAGVVKKYLDFVLSAEGQKLVEGEGFVGLN